MKKNINPMGETVNPEMLILARESRAFTQDELAQRTGISQGNVSRYESGLVEVGPEGLERIAKALDYPLPFFYVADQKHGFGTSCTYHRRKQSVSVTELRTLLARVNVWRIRVAPLLRGANIDSRYEIPQLDFVEYNGDVEKMAAIVRSNWHLPLGPIKNLVGALENAGGIVLRIPFGTKKVDAISHWVPGFPPMFFVNDEIPGDRCRYSLAHELGHLVMHRLHTEDPEREADRFAAELLMPEREIGPDLYSLTMPKLATLKASWRVSMASLIRRAYDLDKVTERQYRSLFEHLSKLGYRLNEPIAIPHEQPKVLKKLFELHQDVHGYSPEELSRLTLTMLDELEEQYSIQPRRSGLRLVG